MNHRSCPTSADLQDLADGACEPMTAAAADRHLLDCGACRDRVRTLRQLEKFATGWRDEKLSGDATAELVSAARVRAVAGDAPIAKAVERSPFGREVLIAATLIVLAAAATASWLAVREAGPRAVLVPKPTAPAPETTAATVQATDLESDAPMVPLSTSVPESTFEESLAEALAAPGRTDDLVRRVGRLLSRPERSAEEVLSGARALLAAAGPRSEATLHGVLRSKGLAFEVLRPLLAEMTGTEATRALIAGVATREPTNADRAALLARPGALEAARAAAMTAPRESRVHAAALVALLGGGDAVDALSDGLRDPGARDESLRALCALGTHEALLAVSRLLPTAESFSPDLRDPETTAVESVARRAPDVGLRAALAAEAAARTSDRRRLLLLAALSGDVAVLPALERAAERNEDRSTAFVAIGVLGAPEGARILSTALAKTADRNARKKGVEALAALSGGAATTALTALLAAPGDRRAAVVALAARADATPGLIAALAFPDARDLALAALRRRAPADGPQTSDHGAWARWWRKKTETE